MLALPFCLLFLVFTVWPVLQSLFMSITDTRAKDLRTPFSVDFVAFDEPEAMPKLRRDRHLAFAVETHASSLYYRIRLLRNTG